MGPHDRGRSGGPGGGTGGSPRAGRARRPTDAAAERRLHAGPHALGAEGEVRAARFLEERGYRIVARDLRAGGVQIDLIARRGPLVAFVEVKTRRSQRLGAPEEALSEQQRARLVRGAAAWLQARRAEGARPARVRFDLVACAVDARGHWHIEHWPGAFDADG